MRSIADIIRDAGGAAAIEAASAGSIKRDAVYKWPGNGVADRHWPVLIELADTTPEELFKANLLARQPVEAAAEAAQ